MRSLAILLLAVTPLMARPDRVWSISDGSPIAVGGGTLDLRGGTAFVPTSGGGHVLLPATGGLRLQPNLLPGSDKGQAAVMVVASWDYFEDEVRLFSSPGTGTEWVGIVDGRLTSFEDGSRRAYVNVPLHPGVAHTFVLSVSERSSFVATEEGVAFGVPKGLVQAILTSGLDVLSFPGGPARVYALRAFDTAPDYARAVGVARSAETEQGTLRAFTRDWRLTREFVLPPVTYWSEGIPFRVNPRGVINPDAGRVLLLPDQVAKGADLWDASYRRAGGQSIQPRLASASRDPIVGKYQVVFAPSEFEQPVRKKLLLLGDSIFANGLVSVELARLGSEAGLYSLAPTGLPGGVVPDKRGHRQQSRQLAQGGKTVLWFATDSASPLVHNGRLDVASFAASNQISLSPGDYVVIQLGINDVFGLGSVEAVDETWRRDRPHLDSIIEQFRAVFPGIRFALCLPILPADDESAFKRQYTTQADLRAYRERLLRRSWQYIEAYARTPDLIFVPLNAALTDREDFKSEWVQDPTTRQVAQRLFDPIHPSERGYQRIAESIFSVLKAYDRLNP